MNDPKNFEFKPGGIIEVQNDGHTELYAGSNAKWWLESSRCASAAQPRFSMRSASPKTESERRQNRFQVERL